MVFSITNHQRNEINTTMKYCLTTVSKNVEQRKPFYTAGVIVNWYSHYETVLRFLKKLKLELPCDPVILLYMYVKEMKSIS